MAGFLVHKSILNPILVFSAAPLKFPRTGILVKNLDVPGLK